MSDDIQAVLALHQQGRLAEAEQGYRAILDKHPDDPDANNLLGALYLSCGQAKQAEQRFRRAAHVRPDLAFFRLNLGKALEAQGQWQKAAESYGEAVRLDPALAEAQNDLGNALLVLGLPQAALAAFDAALAARPDYALAHLNRANLLADHGHDTEAADAYAQALRFDAQQPQAWANFGVLLSRLGRTDQAVEALVRARLLDPYLSHAEDKLAWLAAQTCDWPLLTEVQSRLKKLTAAELEQGRPVGLEPMQAVATYNDDSLVHAVTRNWSQRIAAGAPPVARPQPASHGRLRIGYLSGNFRDHATMHLLGDLFERHDRDAVEVFAYSTGPDDGSPYAEKARRQAEHFVDLRQMSDLSAAERIAADGIQILIELDGHTAGQRLGIVARRPAAVQASWLGFPGTTGADFVDYLIADPVVVPAGAERHYAEAVIRLPHSYQITDPDQHVGAMPPRSELGLPEGIVFAAFHQSFKIEPIAFDAWMRILAAVPGGSLWLLDNGDDGREGLRVEAKKRGIDPGRLLFAPRLPKPQHLARLKQADIALDTRIYNGHATTSDALLAGVPVVSLHGRHFASRVSESLLRAAGLPELVAADLAAYEALAVGLANDPARLAALKTKVATARHSPLFDTQRFVRDLESAYAEMWRIAQTGGPQPFDL